MHSFEREFYCLHIQMKVKVLFSPIVRNQCKILVCCGLPFEKDASLAKGEWIFGGDSEDEEEEE